MNLKSFLQARGALKYWYDRETNSSPFEQAFLENARNGKIEQLRQLAEMGVDLHSLRDATGHSPLALAAKGNHFNAVNFLISLKADVNAVNDAGSSVLDLAKESKANDAIMAVLCEAHALTGKDLYVKNLLFNYARSSKRYTGKELAIKNIFPDWEEKLEALVTFESLLKYVQNKYKQDPRSCTDFLILTDSRGYSLLTASVEHSQEENVRLLLESFNMDPNIIDNEQKTPLDRALTKRIVRLLEENYAFTFVQLALRFKLLWCAAQGNIEEFKKELGELKRDAIPVDKFINAPDSETKLPLVIAARCGQLKMVRYLIQDVGIDLKRQGKAALAAAHERKYNELVIDYLRERIAASALALRGVITTGKDHDKKAQSSTVGVPADVVAFKNSQKGALISAKTEAVDVRELFFFIKNGRANELEKHIRNLRKNGCDIPYFLNHTREERYGDTALGLAIRLSTVECAQILLQNGANPNVINRHGRSPLDHAIYNKHDGFKDLLTRAHALKGEAIKGSPSLWEALSKGDLDAFKNISNAESELINIQDCEGNTLLTVAIKHGHVAIARYLRQEHGLAWDSATQAQVEAATAAQGGHISMLRYLFESTKIAYDLSALVIAAMQTKRQDVVSFLVENYPVDLEEYIEGKPNILDWAITLNATEIANYLREKGAATSATINGRKRGHVIDKLL